MKYVALELAGRKVSAALLDTKSQHLPPSEASAPKVVTAVLPSGSRGGALNVPDITAKFVAQFLKANKLKRYPVSIILDTDQITSNAFSHYPAPAAKLRGVVEMYAGTALPGKIADYAVAYSGRSLLHADGQNRSTLYAAPASQVKRFYQAFHKYGVKVFSVEASGASFSRLVLGRLNGLPVSALALSRKIEKNPKVPKAPKESKRPPKDKGLSAQAPAAPVSAVSVSELDGVGASVFLDFGEHSALVTVCVAGRLLFEQSFPSVYQDMADAYTDATGEDGDSASDFLYKTGLNPDAPIYDIHPDLYRRLSMLVDVTMDDIFRTLRITFSGERTDAESLTVSGDMAAMPGLFERVVHNSANFVAEDKLTKSALVRVTGAAAPKKPYSENLLYTYFKKQNQMATIALVACGLLLGAALIFPAQYWTKKNEQARFDKAQARLTSDMYAEAKALLAEEERIAALRAQFDRAVAQVPFGSRSQAAEYMQLLYGECLRFTQSAAIEYDNQAGVFDVTFVARSLEQYMAFEDALFATGVFEVGIPVDMNVSGACSGTVEVRILNFSTAAPVEPERPAETEGGQNP